MQFLMFSKFMMKMSIEQMADTAAEIGFDGINLLIREVGSITLENATKKLPEAVQAFSKVGQPVKMITTDMTDAQDPHMQSIVASMAENNVPMMRLGYWKYDESLGYHKCMEDAKRDMEKIEKLFRRYKVCAVLQMHGVQYESIKKRHILLCENAQTARQIVEECDPRYVSIWSDPGNMYWNTGTENWGIHYDVIGKYLAVLGTFNLSWTFDEKDKKSVKIMVSIEEGIIDYSNIFSILKKRGFDKTIVAHTEYKFSEEEVIKIAKKDIRFLRKTWEEA